MNNVIKLGVRKGARTDTSNFEAFLQRIERNKIDHFLNKILPYIASQAIRAEECFRNRMIPLLREGIDQKLILTRDEINILLSLMIFCLIPINKSSKLLPKSQDCSFL